MNTAHGPALRGWGRHRTTVLVCAAAGLVLLAAAYPHLRDVAPLLRWSLAHQIGAVAQSNSRTATVSVLIMIANTFLPLPGESVGVLNGAIFGFWGGFAVSWIGVMASAVLAFGIGRALRGCTPARGRIQQLLAYADALVERGLEATLVIRFVPLLPFTVFNVALGRASVGWGTFLWTTALGILPATAVLVAVGCGVTSSRGMLGWGTAALAALIIASLTLRRRIGRDVGAPVRG